MPTNERPKPEPDDWRMRATCRIEQIDPGAFFPPRGDSRKVAAAKAICARCPVTDACLADDLATHHPHGITVGIRGGLAGGERKRLYVHRNRRPIAP